MKVKLSPAWKLGHSELGEYENSMPKNHKSGFYNKRGCEPLVAMSEGFIRFFNNIPYFILFFFKIRFTIFMFIFHPTRNNAIIYPKINITKFINSLQSINY